MFICLIYSVLSSPNTLSFLLPFYTSRIRKNQVKRIELKGKQTLHVYGGGSHRHTVAVSPSTRPSGFLSAYFSFFCLATGPIRQAASMVLEAFRGCCFKKYLSLFNLSYSFSLSSFIVRKARVCGFGARKRLLCVWAYSTLFSGLFCFLYVCVCVCVYFL